MVTEILEGAIGSGIVAGAVLLGFRWVVGKLLVGASMPPPPPPRAVPIVIPDAQGNAPAVFSAVNLGDFHGDEAEALKKVLEEADVQAVLDCLDEGHSVHSAAAIISRKASYREAAMRKFYGR